MVQYGEDWLLLDADKRGDGGGSGGGEGAGGRSMAMAVKSVISEPERWENAPKIHR